MNTHIALKVGHQSALAIIPMDKVIIADLSLALIGPIRRLHLMVKGGAQHFDMTILGHKIDATKAETPDAQNVTDVIARVLDYAEFLGHDHVGVYAIDNLMGYVEAQEKRLNISYNRICSDVDRNTGPAAHKAYVDEHERLQTVKAFVVSGITEPAIFW
ncbi:MAG: hypothetical protein WC052_05710 [Patescibacteria group bacterium]